MGGLKSVMGGERERESLDYIILLDNISISILLFKGFPLFGILIFLIQKYPYTPMFM